MSACESVLVICIKRETERETERRDCCAEVSKVKTHKSHVSSFLQQCEAETAADEAATSQLGPIRFFEKVLASLF